MEVGGNYWAVQWATLPVYGNMSQTKNNYKYLQNTYGDVIWQYYEAKNNSTIAEKINNILHLAFLYQCFKNGPFSSKYSIMCMISRLAGFS